MWALIKHTVYLECEQRDSIPSVRRQTKVCLRTGSKQISRAFLVPEKLRTLIYKHDIHPPILPAIVSRIQEQERAEFRRENSIRL